MRIAKERFLVSFFSEEAWVTTAASGSRSVGLGAVLIAKEAATESEFITLPVCE